MESGELNPYLPPGAELVPSERGDLPPDQLPPVPFEDEDAHPTFGARLWATLKLGYTDPFGLADRIPVTESVFPAWLFNLILQFPFGILGLAVNTALQSLMGRLTGAPVQSSPIVAVISVIAGPVIGIFISGVLLHPCLWVFGGTRQGLGVHQTIRTVGYGSALLAPLGWIPLVNIPLSLVWLVLFGIGLARAHRTDTWRGVCAVLVPLVVVLCCGVGLVVVLMSRGLGGRF